ncbi:hypothetical protein GCM10010232_67670 [Streptomyces amakusaensis]
MILCLGFFGAAQSAEGAEAVLRQRLLDGLQRGTDAAAAGSASSSTGSISTRNFRRVRSMLAPSDVRTSAATVARSRHRPGFHDGHLGLGGATGFVLPRWPSCRATPARGSFRTHRLT